MMFNCLHLAENVIQSTEAHQRSTPHLLADVCYGRSNKIGIIKTHVCLEECARKWLGCNRPVPNPSLAILSEFRYRTAILGCSKMIRCNFSIHQILIDPDWSSSNLLWSRNTTPNLRCEENARKEAKLGWTHVGLSVFKKLSSGDYTQFLDCIYNSEYLMEVWDLVFGNLHLDATLESCLLELTFQVCLNHTSGTLPLEACIVQSRL